MKKNRIIIAGSRSCPEDSWEIYQNNNFKLLLEIEDVEIVSGGAIGADRFGEWVADLLNIPVKRFLPDYNTYGKYAPLKRNTEMSEYATELIALWDGESRGTAHMIREARNMGLSVKIIKI